MKNLSLFAFGLAVQVIFVSYSASAASVVGNWKWTGNSCSTGRTLPVADMTISLAAGGAFTAQIVVQQISGCTLTEKGLYAISGNQMTITAQQASATAACGNMSSTVPAPVTSGFAVSNTVLTVTYPVTITGGQCPVGSSQISTFTRQ
jgi:hypothetical protein